MNLGAELIFPLMTEEEVVIVRVNLYGDVTWENHYAVIGMGAEIADIVLAQRDYDDSMPLMEGLYRIFEAKVAAEANPSVGPSTAFEIQIKGRPAQDLSDVGFRYLERKVRGKKLPKLEFSPEFLSEIKDDDSKSEPAKNSTQ